VKKLGFCLERGDLKKDKCLEWRTVTLKKKKKITRKRRVVRRITAGFQERSTVEGFSEAQSLEISGTQGRHQQRRKSGKETK